jgi:hypothetical protein
MGIVLSRWLLLMTASASILLFALASHRERAATHQVAVIPRQERIQDFPEDENTLIGMNQPGNATPAMRDHGWKLLLHLTSTGDKPLWESWPTKCRLDLSSLCDDATSAKLENPAFPGRSPQIKEVQGKEPRFSTVFYSPDAARFIEDHQLNTGVGLQSILLSNREIPDFPRTAIIVKEIWEGFPLDDNNQPSPSASPIHVYDPDSVVPVQGPDLPEIGDWDSKAIFKLSANGGLDNGQCDQTDFELGPENRVPISCFYTRKFKGTCLAGQPSPGIRGERPDALHPCVLILAGFQIITKEINNWTWTTFWWTNKPDSTKSRQYFAEQPSGLDKRFRHYAMDTTFGPPLGYKGALRPVFNPYLEGPRDPGTLSNCFSCHNNAAYVPACRATDSGCLQHLTGKDVNAGGALPAACPLKPGQDKVAAGCPLKVARIFSLATNQDKDNPPPVLLLTR